MDEIKRISKQEGASEEKIKRELSSGRAVLCSKIKPTIIGRAFKTKVNANIGTSQDFSDIGEEMEKLNSAVEAGADAVMDLSTGGNIREILQSIVKNSPIPVGTVPIYMAGKKALERKKPIYEMTEDDIFNAVEFHLKSGIDFATIHSAITYDSIPFIEKRLMPLVSRGGSFLYSWMRHNKKENPLYSRFDYLLEMLKKYDVIISIGDALRPGCLRDANDRAQIMELKTQAKLVKKCRKVKVGVICEGPGHMPLNTIEKNVKFQQRITKGAPYYVLGPLPTDIAMGFDHIAGAVGGSIAASAGASFLCVVTPNEHIGLPTPEDIKQGVIGSRIAAHIGDIVRLGSKRDEEMSKARAGLNWEAQFANSIYPKEPRERRGRRGTKTDACSMCGDFCALKIGLECSK